MEELSEFNDFERRYELMFRVYNTDLKTRSRNRAQEQRLRSCFRSFIQHLFDMNIFYCTRARKAFANKASRKGLYLDFLRYYSKRFGECILNYLEHSKEFYNQ